MTNTPTKFFNGIVVDTISGSIPSTRGGYMTLLASGTFGGGTLKVQASPDAGTTWIDTVAVLTAAGVINFIAGDGVTYRLNLTGSAAPALSAWVAFES